MCLLHPLPPFWVSIASWPAVVSIASFLQGALGLKLSRMLVSKKNRSTLNLQTSLPLAASAAVSFSAGTFLLMPCMFQPHKKHVSSCVDGTNHGRVWYSKTFETRQTRYCSGNSPMKKSHEARYENGEQVAQVTCCVHSVAGARAPLYEYDG